MSCCMIKLSFSSTLLAGSEMEDEDVDNGYNDQLKSRISPVRTEMDKAVSREFSSSHMH